MENSFFPIFPIVAGLLAGLDSVAGIIQAVSMVVCLASLLGAIFQGFHERSVGGVKTALTIAAVAGVFLGILTAVYTGGGVCSKILPEGRAGKQEGGRGGAFAGPPQPKPSGEAIA